MAGTRVRSMSYVFSTYSLILFLTAAISLALAVTIWRRREAAGARYLALFQVALAEWALGSAFEAAATTLPLKTLWSQISYLGTTCSPVLFFLFAVEYGQGRHRLSDRIAGLLFVVPALICLGAFTNDVHHWLWLEIAIMPDTHLAVYQHGPLFWILVCYSYVFLLAGMVALYRAIFRFPAFYGAQIGALLLASILPIASNVVYVFGLNPIPGVDWTLIAFALTGAILAWILVVQRLFRIVPVARNLLVESMSDGILVLDAQHNLVDFNPSALAILDRPARQLIGKPIGAVLGDRTNDLGRLISDTELETEVRFERGDQRREYNIRLAPVRDRAGRLTGRLVVLRDITEHKRTEEERERLVQELQSALVEVRTLSGLLPICANCKKIRDDQGYWHHVEEYVTEHSDAVFSHGICPDCASKYYAELEDLED